MHRILTIGHSHHPIERFLALLNQHKVEVVADSRSQPYSKYSPQYDRDPLKSTLTQAGIRYVFLGDELGGRPKGVDFYDSKGHVLYNRVAASPRFLAGLARIEKGSANLTTALLCSEESPAACHRRLLVGRVLSERGVSVVHILSDGSLQSEEDLTREETRREDLGQLPLFERDSAPEWKSIPSVLRKRRQASSLGY